MSDSRPSHPTTEPDSVNQPEPRRATHNIPPLVWIVLALLVAWLIVAVVQRGGFTRSPHGGTAPSEAEGSSYMPAAPATPSAPGTPAATINGPQQPAPSGSATPK